MVVSQADSLRWILWKDPISPKDEWDPSAISNNGDLPNWQPHYLVWFLSYDKLFYWIKWANCHLQPCAQYFYSSHTTCTKMCRLLHIHDILVSSHHISVYLWCHNIPNHCDVTGSSVTSSCPLFVAGVVMTPLLTSLTTTKCSWQQMADPCIVGICTTISHGTIS